MDFLRLLIITFLLPWRSSCQDLFVQGDLAAESSTSKDGFLAMRSVGAENISEAHPAPPVLEIPQTSASVFTIVIGKDPNLCLDMVAGHGLSVIQLWECNGHENQLWYFDSGSYKISWAGDRSKCIDSGQGMTPGTQVYLWDCNGLPQQRWGYDGTIFLDDSGTGKRENAQYCLDLSGEKMDLGTAVEIWECNGLWNQQWGLQHGITLRAQANYHFCLDLEGGCLDNGCPIGIWECNGHTNQKWFWDWGSYTIKSSMNSSKCIDAGSDMIKGNSLMIWDCSDVAQQKWSFDTQMQTIGLGSNPAVKSTKCMDISGGELKSGTVMQLWECNVCWNQQFLVTGPLQQMELPTLQLDAAPSPGPLRAGNTTGCPSKPGPPPGPAPPGPSAKVLQHCSAGSQYGWPEFANQAALAASPWAHYFQTVYGEIPTTGYPICTFALTHLYKPIISQSHLTVANKGLPSDAYPHCPTKPGQHYTIMTDHQDSWSSWIWNTNLIEPVPPPASAGLPADYWVEIIHQAYPMDGGAAWMYYAPGTAIWFHLGKTKMWKDHDDAVTELLKQACKGGSGWKPNEHQCIPQFAAMYAAAIKAGLNSMQFYNHGDMPCGSEHHRQNMAVEIVDLGGPGTTSCGMTFPKAAKTGKARYRAGWEAKHECLCDNTQTTVNCKGYGINFIR